MDQQNNSLVPLLAGGLAGVTVDVALYPLDTLKTRLQSAQGFLKAGGFNGIYRGMQSVALGSAPGSALFFTAYETSAPLFTKLFNTNPNQSRYISGRTDGLTIASNSSTAGHLAAASLGEFAACLVRVPTDHLKMRLQAGESTSLLTALQATQRVSKSGIYKGFGITLTREIPFSMVQFPLYEHLKKKLFDLRFNKIYDTMPRVNETNGMPIDDEVLIQRAAEQAKLSPFISSLIGACCGFVAAAITTPLDVARTRIMLGNDPYGNPYQSNPISTMQRIFKEGCRSAKYDAMKLEQNIVVDPKVMSDPLKHPELTLGDLGKYYKGGMSTLFRGVAPRVTWISIGGCVYFGAFETYKNICQKMLTPVLPSTTQQQSTRDIKV